MGAFWRSGYKGTSLADLENATGLTKGSLYKAFEDKHDLFLQALEMYLDASQERLREVLGRPGTAIERIQGWTELAKSNIGKGGCLAVKAGDELGADDSEVRKLLAIHWSRVESEILGVVSAGQEEGSIRCDLDASDIANLLTRIAMGMIASAPICSVPDVGPMLTALELIKGS